jgi:hypothetical protein
MANSKKKGNRFELKVSKWLTEWTGYKFQRTPYSGANHINKELASDIMCSDPKHQHRCRISVECKSYKEIKFEHVLLGNKGSDINRFWEQAKGDAQRSNKVPILCMRYNSMPRDDFFFVVSSKMADILKPVSKKAPYMVLGLGNGDNLIVFMASKIMKEVSYKEFHKLAKKTLSKP